MWGCSDAAIRHRKVSQCPMRLIYVCHSFGGLARPPRLSTEPLLGWLSMPYASRRQLCSVHSWELTIYILGRHRNQMVLMVGILIYFLGRHRNHL